MKSSDLVYDELLVLRCQAGDPRALEELVQRWQPRLLRQVRHTTGRDDAAWDVLQETWMAIIRGLRSLEDPAAFPQWAHRIARHKCADWIRRRQSRRRVGDSRRPTEEPAAPPERSAIGEEDGTEQDELRVALRRMPSDRRNILSMFYSDGMSVSEIAAALEIPAGTVKSRLYHAREELRLLMKGTVS